MELGLSPYIIKAIKSVFNDLQCECESQFYAAQTRMTLRTFLIVSETQ